MKRLIILLALLGALAVPAAAIAIDRAQAQTIAFNEARSLASCGQGGWRCTTIVVNVLGPQGGSIQWAAGFQVTRTGHGTQVCRGTVDIGPYGGVHNPFITCGPPGPLT